MKKESVLIASGGTGGHIFPALVVAQEYMTKGIEVVFVTDKRFHKFSNHFTDILQNQLFHLVPLHAKQPRSKIMRVINIFNTLKLILQGIYLCKMYKPSITIGFGSYTSLPIIIASWLKRVPCMIHEQNAHMGLGNRLSGIFAKVILTSFPETKGFYRFTRYKAIFVGYPLRESVRETYYKNTNSNINYSAFFKVIDRVNILIIGGSQGSKIFTQIIPDMIKFLDDDIQSKLCIYHQARHEDVHALSDIYSELGIWYHVKSFFPDIARLMTMSHLVISRSGAGSVSELCASGSPSILVPYKYATNNHQYLNAKYLYENGGCLLIDEDSITPEKIASIISTTINNEETLLGLSEEIKKLAIVDAHIKIISIGNILSNKKTIKIDDIKKGVNTNSVGIG